MTTTSKAKSLPQSSANDEMIHINDSLIQHGNFNDRVYVMKLGEENIAHTLKQVEELARDQQYSKIFIKSSGMATERLKAGDYTCEAQIPKFYRGEEDAHFMVKYLTHERKQMKHKAHIKEVLQVSMEKQLALDNDQGQLPLSAFKLRELTVEDSKAMAGIYKQVFTTYPFPIHDPKYIAETMSSHVKAYGIFDKEQLVGLASCEMDIAGQNVEMTDFATLPGHRGKKIAQKLLKFMEKQMKQAGMKTAYTIARAKSLGMNITFSKRKYKYSGTLINNTNISGDIESMNVWYRPLK